MNESTATRVAAAHLAPVWLDKDRTIDKVCRTIERAASEGARLLAFPEAFVPAFPVWSALRAPIHNHDLFRRLVEESLFVDGPEMSRVRRAAASNEIVVSLGFNERTRDSVGCLFNSNVLIDQDGTIVNHHRKIVPTFYEKLTWAPGDGAGLRVCATRIGRIGTLICGENTNPLARFSLIAQGEQIHVSTYPPVWPTHPPDDTRPSDRSATPDRPATGRGYRLAEAIRLRAAAHSFEAKAFNVVSSAFMDEEMLRLLSGLCPEAESILRGSSRGVSLITDPTGQVVSEELIDREGIVHAEIDLRDCVEPKQFHDVSGGYNRFDIFRLRVDRSARRPVRFSDELPEEREDARDEGKGDGEE